MFEHSFDVSLNRTVSHCKQTAAKLRVRQAGYAMHLKSVLAGSLQ
jgi:hypothetical protein